MNICFLTSTYLPLVGGLEIVVHNLAIALTNLGHNVYVVTPRSNNRKQIDNYRYKVVRIGFKGYGRLKLATASAVATLAYVVKRYKIDVINVHNVFRPASWAYLFNHYFKRIPTVGTPHGDDIQIIPEINWGVRLNPGFSKIVERNLKSCTLITAISQPILKELQLIGIEPKVIHSIPNGIWAQQFKSSVDKTAIRKKLGIPLNSIIAISIGRNHPVKGYKYGVEAISTLRNSGINISYVIVGRDMSMIVEKARTLGISDCLITPGEVEFFRIADFLQAADIFVSTSILESFSMTTLEAMSSGLPSVVTSSSGVKDLIGHECGMIVKPENPDHLASAIQYLIENPDVRERMGKESKKRAQQYDWHFIAKKYIAVYEKAITNENIRIS